ncbi:MAG: hypothetical protein SPE31_06935 [Prevotella sp.]|nr:hypothetical protein [Prevotella sp.]
MRNMFRTLTRLASYAVFTLAVITSCQTIADEDITDPGRPSETGRHKVNVVTRSAAASASLVYPITVNAISPTGDIVDSQKIESSADKLALSLPEGDYTLVATAGGRSFPDGYSTHPTMTGKTAVRVSGSAVSANIIMGYAVSRLDISLAGLPSTVTAATVTLAPLHGGLTEAAEYSGEGQATIPLSRGADGIWTTGTVYVMPSSKAETVMTVTISREGEAATAYGIAYHEGLKAAVPYIFKGVFSDDENDGIEITGSLSCADWDDTVEGEFSFGPSGSNAFGGSTGGSSDAGIINVGAMPEAGDICGGHIVAMVDDDGNALLMSTTEWDGLTSAYNETDPDVAARIAGSYQEDDMSEWRIPTSDEAASLMSRWGGEQADVLNATLTAAGLSPLTLKEQSTGNNARYLCSDATQTFSFAAGAKMAAAGRTVKTYRLRLMKSVRYVVR